MEYSTGSSKLPILSPVPADEMQPKYNLALREISVWTNSYFSSLMCLLLLADPPAKKKPLAHTHTYYS